MLFPCLTIFVCCSRLWIIKDNLIKFKHKNNPLKEVTMLKKIIKRMAKKALKNGVKILAKKILR